MARVMVVDDEPDLRFLARRLLEHHGMEVAEAPNGLAALEAVRADMPDVVVTDLHMPVMNGRELIRRLRSDPRTCELPIIMWSADPDRDAGADQVLAKPYLGARMVELIRDLIAQRGA